MSPSATPAASVELVLRLRKQLTDAGLDAGADTIGWHLRHHHRVTVSRATINRILIRNGSIDEQVSRCTQRGVKERLYFLRVPLPLIDDTAPGVVKPALQRYHRITFPVASHLIAIARTQLGPPPIPPPPPMDAARSRADFDATIKHRPGDPRQSLSL